MPSGVVAVDATGRPWHVNRAASEILERNDGLTLSGQRGLSSLNQSTAAALVRLIGSVLSGEEPHAGGQLKVPRRNDARPYCVLVAPLPIAAVSRFDAPEQRGALLLISDPDRSNGHDLKTAMDHYRLTPAEFAVLSALVDGHSLQEHCRERGISINTGKFHLRSLFAKTDARGQSDLVRIALMAMQGD